jgi:hypothetical protein
MKGTRTSKIPTFIGVQNANFKLLKHAEETNTCAMS